METGLLLLPEGMLFMFASTSNQSQEGGGDTRKFHFVFNPSGIRRYEVNGYALNSKSFCYTKFKLKNNGIEFGLKNTAKNENFVTK